MDHVISRALVPFPPYRTPPMALTLKGALPIPSYGSFWGFSLILHRRGGENRQSDLSWKEKHMLLKTCKRSTTSAGPGGEGKLLGGGDVYAETERMNRKE